MPTLNSRTARAFTATRPGAEASRPSDDADILITDPDMFNQMGSRVYPDWSWVNTMTNQWEGGYPLAGHIRDNPQPTNDSGRLFTRYFREMITQSAGLRLSDRMARALARPVYSLIGRTMETMQARVDAAETRRRTAMEATQVVRRELQEMTRARDTAATLLEQNAARAARYDAALDAAREWLDAGNDDPVAKYAAYLKFEEIMRTMASDARAREAERTAADRIRNTAAEPATAGDRIHAAAGVVEAEAVPF